MSGHHNGLTHDFEPVRGLPGLLPRGERVLWQGAPDWAALAWRAFLGGPIALYFGLLMAWRLADHMMSGTPLREAVIHTVWLGLVGLVALAVVGVMAWATARSTIYTITNRRVVIRSGVALTLSLNVPFKKVAAANLQKHGRRLGDLSLQMGGKDQFSYLMLWPHIRPWMMSKPEPTLRCLPDAESVARTLAEALVAYEAQVGMDLEEQTAPTPAKAGAASADSSKPRPAGGLVAAE